MKDIAPVIDFEVKGNTLRICGPKTLDENSGRDLREKVFDNVKSVSTHIEVDLSQTESVTGAGLGALVYLQKVYNNVSLIDPLPPVQQVLHLTRMDRIFDIVKKAPERERIALAS